jgi:hypothetical protein
VTFVDAVNARKALVDKVGFHDAYLVLAVAMFIEEPDAEALASSALTEGGNDKKIDLIHIDRDARRLVFAQGYMGTKKNDSAPANKASDLNTACAWLISGDLSTVPPKLSSIVEESRSAILAGDIDFIDLLYVHNLPNSINVARELQTVEDHLRVTLANEKILVKSHELGSARLEHLFAAQESHIAVSDDIPFPSEIGITQSGATWAAGVATVSGEWVSGLYARYGDELYSANYRGFLGADGRKRVNKGIRETVEQAPSDFWAFNNGITILTLEIRREKIGKDVKISLRGASVINGAQTTGSIGSVDATRSPLADVKLLCRVIQCSDQETIDKIVKYNNTQNAITTWDQFSNDEDQKRIDEEFAELGFSYNRKRGFSAAGDQIGIEQVLQPLLAYHGRPTDAVRGKNQLFVQKPLYRNAFDGIKARHILFVYALSRAIDNKRTDLKAKSNTSALIAVEEKQLDLLRNLNFKPFLIAVIANSLETILGVPCDNRTVGFKPSAAKGTGISELAARWLPVVESFLPLLTSLVKPDEFFRNLSGDEGYLDTIKGQMDGFLSATQAVGKHATFIDMVATS